MTKKIAVLPFFERAGRDGDLADSYVAGLRGEHDGECGVEVRLPAELVDRTVLVSAQLSISLAPDGHFVLDAEEVSATTRWKPPARSASPSRRFNLWSWTACARNCSTARTIQ